MQTRNSETGIASLRQEALRPSPLSLVDGCLLLLGKETRVFICEFGRDVTNVI